MDTFRARFPSRGEIWLVFSSIIFVVNIWAIINILRAIPSWILSRTIGEIVGIISYPLSFALLESVIFLLGITILAVILPGKFLLDRFVPQGSMAALIATLGMIAAHLYGNDFGIWSVRDFGKYLLVLAGIVLVSWVLIFYFEKIAGTIGAIAKRITPLSMVYLALDSLAVLMVVMRNI